VNVPLLVDILFTGDKNAERDFPNHMKALSLAATKTYDLVLVEKLLEDRWGGDVFKKVRGYFYTSVSNDCVSAKRDTPNPREYSFKCSGRMLSVRG